MTCSAALLLMFVIQASAADKLIYQNDFEKAQPGKLPEDFMVLDGAFVVREEGGNNVLELPGTPLETFGVLFGPNESSGVAVTARIYGTARGRRAPAFAVGLNGVAGHKLQLSPTRKALELRKGDEVIASVPATWESGAWTMLRLESKKLGEGQWKIEGKAWKQGDQEPQKPQVSHVETTEPLAGKGGVWGAPYSGTPIRFDDLTITSLQSK